MRTEDFKFHLPPQLIAQSPAADRDRSRLLVLSRPDGHIEHRSFRDLIEYLQPGDLLILNNSRVIPARLRAQKSATRGAVEVLLVEQTEREYEWWVMLKPGKRVRPGTELLFRSRAGEETELRAEVLAKNEEGHCLLRFSGADLHSLLPKIGEVPLPPYITRPPGAEGVDDERRYQTVYSSAAGSVAAPTAGLHFTEQFLGELKAKGIEIAAATLHVGLGTFAPVKAREIESHRMHSERFVLPEKTAQSVNRAKERGNRVVAVGTTSVRILETAARSKSFPLSGLEGKTDIFIYPPFPFRAVDALLTNFHLPESTLLMLVSAFAEPSGMGGRELVLRAYQEAIQNRYRFFSYGDAMLVL